MSTLSPEARQHKLSLFFFIPIIDNKPGEKCVQGVLTTGTSFEVYRPAFMDGVRTGEDVPSKNSIIANITLTGDNISAYVRGEYMTVSVYPIGRDQVQIQREETESITFALEDNNRAIVSIAKTEPASHLSDFCYTIAPCYEPVTLLIQRDGPSYRTKIIQQRS